MRILASGKRDSVTGEEVVAVSHVVASSGYNNHNSNSINNTVNNSGPGSDGAVILALSSHHHHSTLPAGKLAGAGTGVVGSSSELVSSTSTTGTSSSSSSTKRGRRKYIKKVNSKTLIKAKVSAGGGVGVGGVGGVGAFSWRNRIGKGAEDFFTSFLSDYCCAWIDDKDRDYYLSKKREKEGGGERRIVESSSVKEEGASVSAVTAEVVVSESKLEGSGGGGGSAVKSCESESCTTRRRSEVQEENNPSLSCCQQTPSSAATATVIVSPATNKDIDTDTDTNVDVKTCNEDLVKPIAPGTTAIVIKNMRAGIYHEKQVKSLCALHALNNLLQDAKAFKQEDLDKICSELDPNSWVNPHKSVFGLGNYDINVIMTALQQKKLEAIWFDKRKDPSEELNFDNIYGFILNIPSECKLGWLALPIKRKHWVAIRNLPSITERDSGRNNFYNLDSKFDKPESIGSTDNLVEYLRSELRSPEKELFLVVIEDVGRLETWRKNPPPPPSESVAALSSSLTSSSTGGGASSSMKNTPHLPLPGDNGNPLDNGNNRRTSNDSGVVDLLPDLRDINVVDLNKEDLMRRQSSGVWSDMT